MRKWKSERADHQAAAAAARQVPGDWTYVTVYPSGQSADGVARAIGKGTMAAYRPAGLYDAYAARHEDGAAVWVRYLDGVDDPQPLPDSLTVRVPDYGTQVGYEGVTIRTVVIYPTCQQCGAPRGKARSTRYAHDGAVLSCDTWENPCGHDDPYLSVLAEAKLREEFLTRMLPKSRQIQGLAGGLFADAVDLIGELVAHDPTIRAQAAADVVEQAGHAMPAEVIRAFANGGPAAKNMLARSAALYLNERDVQRATAAESLGGAL